jgi:hypothetical protein
MEVGWVRAAKGAKNATSNITKPEIRNSKFEANPKIE